MALLELWSLFWGKEHRGVRSMRQEPQASTNGCNPPYEALHRSEDQHDTVTDAHLFSGLSSRSRSTHLFLSMQIELNSACVVLWMGSGNGSMILIRNTRIWNLGLSPNDIFLHSSHHLHCKNVMHIKVPVSAIFAFTRNMLETVMVLSPHKVNAYVMRGLVLDKWFEWVYL